MSPTIHCCPRIMRSVGSLSATFLKSLAGLSGHSSTSDGWRTSSCPRGRPTYRPSPKGFLLIPTIGELVFEALAMRYRLGRAREKLGKLWSSYWLRLDGYVHRRNDIQQT